jgi:hypothetical protein
VTLDGIKSGRLTGQPWRLKHVTTQVKQGYINSCLFELDVWAWDKKRENLGGKKQGAKVKREDKRYPGTRWSSFGKIKVNPLSHWSDLSLKFSTQGNMGGNEGGGGGGGGSGAFGNLAMAKLKSDQVNKDSLVSAESVDEPPQPGNNQKFKYWSKNQIQWIHPTDVEEEDPIVKAEREFFEIIKQVRLNI